MSTSGAGSGTNDYDQALNTSLHFPSVARIYDYHLGGGYHWAIDRVHAEEQLKQMPNIPVAMRVNRAFLGRAVRYAVLQGIRQFVDIGSGLPTVGQVTKSPRTRHQASAAWSTSITNRSRTPTPRSCSAAAPTQTAPERSARTT